LKPSGCCCGKLASGRSSSSLCTTKTTHLRVIESSTNAHEQALFVGTKRRPCISISCPTSDGQPACSKQPAGSQRDCIVLFFSAALGVVPRSQSAHGDFGDVVFTALDGDIARDCDEPLKLPQPTRGHIRTPYPVVGCLLPAEKPRYHPVLFCCAVLCCLVQRLNECQVHCRVRVERFRARPVESVLTEDNSPR